MTGNRKTRKHMVGQARPFSRVTLGIGAALTLGFTSLVAPAAADESDSNASCESKGWEEVAEELLGDAEPKLCDEASDQLALISETDSGEKLGDDTVSVLEDVAAATSVVGAGRNGETVILVNENDEEIVDFLETAYPNATVESNGGFSSLAAIDGDVVGGAGIYSLTDPPHVAVCSLGFPAWSPEGAPAALTAGHCTNDGSLEAVGLSDPRGDEAADDDFDIADDLGVYGFSQYGGPDNTPGEEGTDIAVIDVTNNDLDLAPEVTDWTTPENLSSSTTPITGVASVDQNGPKIERSGRTTGHSDTSASNVTVVDGIAKIDNERPVRGFLVKDLWAGEGDSGGPVYQGGNAIGLVSGGNDLTGDVWATDLQDALSYTNGYVVQVFVAAPEMASPADGGTVAAGSAIRGNAPAGTTLVVTPVEGDAFEVEVDNSGEWSFTVSEDDLGEYGFSLKAIAANELDESESVDYEVTVTIPAPAFTSLEDGDVVNEPISVVTGTGLDDATVTLEVDGEVVGSADVVDGEWSTDVDLGYGQHELVASQELGDEVSADATASVTVAPAAPTITSPEDGSSFDVGDVPAAVEGTGLEGATVALAVDGEEVGTDEVVDGEWSIDLPSDLDAGDYELTAVQTIAGASSVEAAVTIAVNEVVEVPDDGADDNDDVAVPPLPETGINDGITPALIAAALLIAAGTATRIWKRAAA